MGRWGEELTVKLNRERQATDKVRVEPFKIKAGNAKSE